MERLKNIFAELEAYFNEKYLSPDLSGITNYDATDIQRFLPLLIIGLSIGTFLAICISYYNCHYLGKVVRKLYKSGAFSKETAKTLEEIDCNSFFIRSNLVRSTVLSKYVKPVTDAENQKDAENTAYYILEEQKYIADKRFKEAKGGKLSILISFIICAAVCFILLYIVPDILQLADNAYNMLKPQ